MVHVIERSRIVIRGGLKPHRVKDILSGEQIKACRTQPLLYNSQKLLLIRIKDFSATSNFRSHIFLLLICYVSCGCAKDEAHRIADERENIRPILIEFEFEISKLEKELGKIHETVIDNERRMDEIILSNPDRRPMTQLEVDAFRTFGRLKIRKSIVQVSQISNPESVNRNEVGFLAEIG
jgi:hypothetical protein